MRLTRLVKVLYLIGRGCAYAGSNGILDKEVSQA